MVEYKTEIVNVYCIDSLNDGSQVAIERKNELEKVLNKNADEGWHLKTMQACGRGNGSQNSAMLLIFEREITEGEITL